jgi:hypothetical protein
MALIYVRIALREKVSYSQASFFFLLYESIDQNSQEKKKTHTQIDRSKTEIN